MRTLILAAAALVAAFAPPAAAQQGTYRPWTQPGGGEVPGLVILCATGVGREAVPCGSPDSPLPAMVMPFVRSGIGDPFIFTNLSTTPKQFAITKPADATGYRFVNPCDVDVRIRKVGSMSEQVTLTTGTLYLARTVEIMGTSNPTFLSAMTMAEPATPCSPELQYGKGSGG